MTSRTKAGTVLIVDDEPLIRTHIALLAEDANYDFVEAASAEGAIALLEARPDIRIIITDINMPGSMDGLALARLARNRWPPLEIIVVSGNKVPERGDLPERGLFFAKPFDEVELTDALARFAA